MNPLSHHIIAASLTDAFVQAAQLVYHSPDFTVSPRGHETREAVSVLIEITDPRQRVIEHPARRFSLRYAVAEWLWYQRSSNRLDEIAHYAKFWESVSDDGEAVNSAYGYRLTGRHPAAPVNQWQYVVDELTRDRASRRAVALIALPADMTAPTKDFPCTLVLQFMIRGNQLHVSVHMRSNDLVWGFTNDVFAFTMMQEYLLAQLQGVYPELTLGRYWHYAGSLHAYDRHFGMLEEVSANPPARSPLQLAPLSHPNELPALQHNELVMRTGRGQLKPLTGRLWQQFQAALQSDSHG